MRGRRLRGAGDADWKDLENRGEDGGGDGARDGDGGERRDGDVDEGAEFRGEYGEVEGRVKDGGGVVVEGAGLGSTVFDTQSMRGLTLSSQGMPRITA